MPLDLSDGRFIIFEKLLPLRAPLASSTTVAGVSPEEVAALEEQRAAAEATNRKLRGDVANLAGHTNQKQKIHYLETMSKENAKLRKENLTLQVSR